MLVATGVCPVLFSHWWGAGTSSGGWPACHITSILVIDIITAANLPLKSFIVQFVWESLIFLESSMVSVVSKFFCDSGLHNLCACGRVTLLCCQSAVLLSESYHQLGLCLLCFETTVMCWNVCHILRVTPWSLVVLLRPWGWWQYFAMKGGASF